MPSRAAEVQNVSRFHRGISESWPRSRICWRHASISFTNASDELGIELRARAALDLADRDLVLERAAIGAVGGHRVVGVGDRDDAADERDVLAREPARIAAAVEPLVVAPAAVDQAVQARHRLEDALALLGVLAEDGDLLGRQLAGLVEHVVADADLADVVHHARLHDAADLGVGQREAAREHLGVHGDALGVAARVHVALLERLREARRRSAGTSPRARGSP